MPFDKHQNFAYAAIATAPSPATTGTSLVVSVGAGARFPVVPFNVVVWPAGALPLAANAEIVRVTAITTDTFTIVRTQESTSARTIVVGDQIAAAITLKTLTDIEAVTAMDGQLVFPASQNASTNANTLDDYEEGVFTAALAFGGAAVGITYAAATTNGCTYVKIGKNIYVSGYIELTSKGSSTGAATLTGLPFTNEGSNRSAAIGTHGVFTGLTGMPHGLVIAGGATISLFQSSATTSAGLTDAVFTNTTYLFFFAMYRATA